MTEQEFEALLAAYIEDQVSDEDLSLLKRAIDRDPGFKRRFREELRLHTLMAEVASEHIEQVQVRPMPPHPGHTGRGWHWLGLGGLIAACLVMAGLIGLVVWKGPGPKAMGRCLHVTEEDDLVILRHGREVHAREKTAIFVDDQIRTGFEANAMVQLDNVGILSLDGANLLSICQTDQGDTEIHLERGHVLFEIAKLGQGDRPFTVETQQAILTVLGTIFEVEAEPTAMQIKVYEGLVGVQDSGKGGRVQVGVGQYAITGGPTLQVGDLATLPADKLMSSKVTLLPSDDAYLQGEEPYNHDCLYVEGGRRIIFLKFKVQDVGTVLGARLCLTQSMDVGSGTLRFFEGSPKDWSERTLTPRNAPMPIREIARRTGAVQRGQTIEVDMSTLIKGDGVYTLVITLDEGGPNDIRFGSKESNVPPKLILTCRRK